MHEFIKKNWGKEIADGARLPLQPLTDIHFDTRYLNNTISYTTSRETYYVLAAVAVLIIIIACINFINLATAQAMRRAKEIGVRKVLGASVFNVWNLLSKDFVMLVIISFVIATPLAYYFMHNWLQNYTYRTQLSWWIFAAAGTGSLIITVLVVSFQAIKAAVANPVKSLRTE